MGGREGQGGTGGGVKDMLSCASELRASVGSRGCFLEGGCM